MSSQISQKIELPELKFSEEEYTTIQDMAGCNYSPEKIAINLEVDKKAFLKLWFDKESEVRKRYDLGQLKAEFEINNKQKALAMSGNITATQIFLKEAEKNEVNNIRNRILFGDDY